MRKEIISKKILVAFVQKEKQKIMIKNEKNLHTGDLKEYQDNANILRGLSIVDNYLKNGSH